MPQLGIIPFVTTLTLQYMFKLQLSNPYTFDTAVTFFFFVDTATIPTVVMHQGASATKVACEFSSRTKLGHSMDHAVTATETLSLYKQAPNQQI